MATIARLVTLIEAQTQGFEAVSTKLDAIDKSVGSLGATAVKVGELIGGAFTVQQLGKFLASVVADADALQRLHDTTGETVENLQGLQLKAVDAGGSVDALTSAFLKLEQRLGSGNAGTVKGLHDLNIEASSFSQLGLAAQYQLVSVALEQVSDPLDRARILSQLFGKQWIEIVPLLKAGADGLSKMGVASAASVTAVDASGDAVAALTQRLKNWSIEMLGTIQLGGIGNRMLAQAQIENQRLSERVTQNTATLRAANRVAQERDQLQLPNVLREETRGWAEMDRELEKNHKAVTTATEAARKAQEDLDKVIAEAWAETVKYVAAQVAAVEGTQELKVKTLELEKALDSIGDGFHELWQETTNVGETFTVTAEGPLTNLVEKIEQIPKPVKQVGTDLSGLSQAFANMATVAGGSLGTVFKFVGLGITTFDAFTKAMEKVSKVSTETGENISSSMDVASAALASFGASYALTYLVLTSILDRHKAQIDKIHADMVKWQGDIGTIGDAYVKAGMDATQAFTDWQLVQSVNNDNLAEAQAAMDRINKALQNQNTLLEEQEDLDRRIAALTHEQDETWQELNETLKKYNINLTDAGPLIAQKKLVEVAKELYRDFTLLTLAGVPLNVVLEHMGGSINEMVHQALQLGLEIPSAMKPMLDSMAAAGLLTDQFGNKLKDTSSIKFSVTLSEGFNKIIDRLDTLLMGLGLIPQKVSAAGSAIGVLVGQLLNIPNTVNVNFTQTGPNTASNASRGGLVMTSGIQAFAGGGRVLPFLSRGTDTVPAMLTPGEMVLTPSQQAAMRGSGGVTELHTTVVLDGRVVGRSVERVNSADLRLQRKLRAS